MSNRQPPSPAIQESLGEFRASQSTISTFLSQNFGKDAGTSKPGNPSHLHPSQAIDQNEDFELLDAPDDERQGNEDDTSADDSGLHTTTKPRKQSEPRVRWQDKVKGREKEPDVGTEEREQAEVRQTSGEEAEEDVEEWDSEEEARHIQAWGEYMAARKVYADLKGDERKGFKATVDKLRKHWTGFLPGGRRRDHGKGDENAASHTGKDSRNPPSVTEISSDEDDDTVPHGAHDPMPAALDKMAVKFASSMAELMAQSLDVAAGAAKKSKDVFSDYVTRLAN